MKLEIEITPKSFSSPFRFSPEEINRMLEHGIQAARDNNRREARQWLEQVTEAEPENETAWLWLASISEYPEELLGFLQHVLKMNPQNEQALEWTSATKSLLADNFFQLGADAAQNDQKEFAQRCFSRAVSHDSRNENAWLEMAALAETQDEKTSHLQKVLEINPANEKALAGLEAIKQENFKALLKKANVAAISGERETALQLIDEIMQSEPEREDIWILKAYLAQTSEEKIAGYEKVLEINPGNDAAQAGLAALRALIQKTEEQKPFAEALKAAIEASDISSEPINEPTAQAAVEEAAPQNSSEEFSELPTAKLTMEAIPEAAVHFSNSAESESLNLDSFDDSPEKVDEQVSSADTVAHLFEMPVEKNQTGSHDSFSDLESQNYQNAEDFVAYGDEVEILEDAKDDESNLLHLSDAQFSFAADDDKKLADFLPSSENQMFSNDKDYQATENFESGFNAAAWQNQQSSDNSVSNANYFSEESMSQSEFGSSNFFSDSTVQKEQSATCAFCYMKNDPEAVICSSCRTIFSLSDLEMLLGYQAANPEVLHIAISKLETARLNRTISPDELKTLALAYLNAKDLSSGLARLREAAKFSPNDFELASAIDFLKAYAPESDEQEFFAEVGGSERLAAKASTIMVVDDNPTILKLVSGKLEKCGHTVIPALNGEEALTKINEVTPDLILLDITMPKMDGYQVCQIIRSHEETKNVPVLMISSKDGIFDESRGRKVGSTGFIAKPFGPETLMRTVENYLG